MKQAEPTLSEAIIGFVAVVIIFLLTAWLEGHQYLFY